MMYQQEPPFCIQVELTEGCNLMCNFCGIHSIRANAGDFNFMSKGLADKLAHQISEVGWNPRIEFAMHGEPTLNRQASAIIEIFRKHLPETSLMMLTNGAGLLNKNKIKSLFDAGLNTLGLEDYQHNRIIFDEIQKHQTQYEIFNYPKDKNVTGPHTKFHKKRIIIIKDITRAIKGGHSILNNHCGCAYPPLIKPLKARCAKPFREISIRWDGNVAICCNDWRGVYKCGNIIAQPIDKIWNNEFFHAARMKLYHYQRDFKPCCWCDARSYRVGLLPDKMGKSDLPLPCDSTNKYLNEATKGKLYSKTNLLKWERFLN